MSARAELFQLRRAYWKDIIRQRYEEGGTVKEFCRKHNIKYSTYYAWFLRLRKERPIPVTTSYASTEAPVFAEVTPPLPMSAEAVSVPVATKSAVSLPTPPDAVYIQCGTFRVAVTEHTSVSLLQKTLRVLAEVATDEN